MRTIQTLSIFDDSQLSYHLQAIYLYKRAVLLLTTLGQICN